MTKGKRKLSIGLALKIERVFRFGEGSLLMFQTFYVIKEKELNESSEYHPGLPFCEKLYLGTHMFIPSTGTNMEKQSSKEYSSEEVHLKKKK